MIFLSEDDIRQCVDYTDVVEAVEDAFVLYERKEFTMPDRMHIDFGRNTFLLMPCLGREYFSTKLVTVYPGNAGTDIPVIDGVIVLNSMQNGTPLALLNGRIVTALRTGAAGAVSVKYLTPENVTKLGIVGAGVQAFYQVMLTASVKKLTHVTVLSARRESAVVFAEKIAAHLPGIQVRAADSGEDLLENSEIVITATTSKYPVLPEREDLLRGKHFVGIGSFKPDVREFPRALYRLVDKVYVDTMFAAEESGDLVYPLEQKWISGEQVQTLGRYLLESGRRAPRQETTFYKSVGMALFDLVASQAIYEQAVKKGLGKNLLL